MRRFAPPLRFPSVGLEGAEYHSGPVPDALRLQMPSRRVVDLLVRVVCYLTLFAIPFTLATLYHFLPFDDCLRHAAKAVVGRAWSDVLVMPPGVPLDEHPGWHATLSGASAAGLVVISYVALFLVVTLSPLPAFRRPEAYLTSLMLAVLAMPDVVAHRLTRGRPYLLTFAVLLLVLVAWRSESSGEKRTRGVQNSPTDFVRWLVTTAGIGLSVWMHGTVWYLWWLPGAAFVLAGRRRAGVELLGCWLAGALLGASLTGHPFGYLAQQVVLVGRAFGQGTEASILVGEFRPYFGGAVGLAVLAGVSALRRHLTGHWLDVERDGPLVALMLLAFVPGLRVARFFTEWSLPALLLLLAFQLEAIAEASLPGDSPRRVLLTLFAAAALWSGFTADNNERWSYNQFAPAATARGDAQAGSLDALAEWLPRPGGILYSWQLDVFLRLFFTFPQGDWRYAYGYEAGLMADENRAVLKAIQKSNGRWSTFEPWVAKLRPEDRLVVLSEEKPGIPALEWQEFDHTVWYGRLRQGAR